MKYKLKSVKLWITVVLLIMGTAFAFLMTDRSFHEWSKFIMWLTGFYFAGNVLSKTKKPTTVNVRMDPNQSPESEQAFEVIEERVPPYEECH